MADKINPSRIFDESAAKAEAAAQKAEHALTGKRSTNPALWTGVCIGALLNVVMIAALVAADRFPRLEPYALERNAVSYSFFVLLLLLPVLRFMKRPKEMFVAGIVGWAIFSAGYNVAGLFFHSLFDVLRTPFEVLTEGAVVYGVAAVLSWVIIMIIEARRHSIAPRRRSSVHDAVHFRP
jgi:hypothetical protein